MALFLYGTLMHPLLFAIVAGPGEGESVQATLTGHAVERSADGPWPALVGRPDGVARGLLRRGLSTAQVERLDRYETPFGFDRRPVTVATEDGEQVAATAYFSQEGGSGLPWDLNAWAAAHGMAALLAAEEVDWSAPDFEGAAVARQWPMTRMRAAARVRAVAQRAPATLRRQGGPGDYGWHTTVPDAGSFFRLSRMALWNRRFDGTSSDDLSREVLVGADASLVLPYDVVRDRVLLVEQFRAGPARRDDANPWTLEPVAGIVDADETPEEAARRETEEEAQLTLSALRPMFRVYASPGSTTDHFYCFLGLADLPDGHATTGGLAEEAEDLRLHVIPFDRAMALLDAGEVTAAPLAAMLLWLARAREGLRSELCPGA